PWRARPRTRQQPGRARDVDRAGASPVRAVPASRAPPLQPAAGEARPAEAAHHVLVVPHQIPDHARAMVLDHEQDGTLVDADVVVVEPTDARNDATARRAARAGEREVECIAEAVLTVEPRAERTVHLPECGNRDLGCEGDGAA